MEALFVVVDLLGRDIGPRDLGYFFCLFRRSLIIMI